MRLLLIFSWCVILISSNSSVCYSQNKKGKSSNKISTPPKISNSDNSTLPESSPDYIGGDSAYHNFLDNNLEYPLISNRDKRIVSVRVMASFTVESTGKLSNFSFITDFEILGNYSKSDYKVIEEEYSSYFENATRNFLLKMPRWKPAQYKGRSITTEWSLPVVFRYEQTDESKFTNIEDESEKEVVFTRVDKEVEYTGGQTAMYKFIEKNLVLPKSNESTGNNQNDEPASFKIIVGFYIDIDGSLKEIIIKNKSAENEKFESAIIQCFQKMPLWKPAEQNGKPIKMYKQIPITISQ